MFFLRRPTRLLVACGSGLTFGASPRRVSPPFKVQTQEAISADSPSRPLLAQEGLLSIRSAGISRKVPFSKICGSNECLSVQTNQDPIMSTIRSLGLGRHSVRMTPAAGHAEPVRPGAGTGRGGPGSARRAGARPGSAAVAGRPGHAPRNLVGDQRSQGRIEGQSGGANSATIRPAKMGSNIAGTTAVAPGFPVALADWTGRAAVDKGVFRTPGHLLPIGVWMKPPRGIVIVTWPPPLVPIRIPTIQGGLWSRWVNRSLTRTARL